jgi:Dullard-like phosphatase family protein
MKLTPRNQRPQISLQGNILAKSSKLTIEVPNEEEEPSASRFNKNSPTYSKFSSELQKASGSIFAPKNKSPASISIAKRCYGDSVPPKVTPKIFKFPSSPKNLPKKQAVRPAGALMSRSKSKAQAPLAKISSTPTHKNLADDIKIRPKTTTNAEKQVLKAETGSSPSLTTMVTQVKSSNNRLLETMPAEDLQAKSEMLYKEHLFQTFQAMKFVRTLQPVNIEQLKEKRINIPRRKGWEGKKTLIFDLDETLVHCCEDINTSRPTVVLPVVFPTGETVQAGINVRPFAIECLREVNKDFEVFVFTASHQCYANVVLDYLDPGKELIHQRFFRDSCINMGGVFIKDLRIFANRNLKDMVIVDNAAYSFAYQLDNGIPIVSWHEDPNDRELFNLMDYVKALAAVPDIRDLNEQTFHLRTFYEDYINEFLANDPSHSPKTLKNQ